MTTQNIYQLLKEEIQSTLRGELKYTGDVIKYQYDSFQQNDSEDDIEEICYDDRNIIDDWLTSEYEEFFTTEPEIDEDIAIFYIEK